MAKVYKREFLETVAEEMNKVMALTPPMEVSMPDDDTLLDTIKYNATGGGHADDAIRDSDKFSDEVWAFFKEVGVWDAKDKTAICPPPVKKTKPAKETAAPVEEKSAPKQAKGKTDKKSIPVEEPEDEEGDEPEEEEMSTKKATTKKAETHASKATRPSKSTATQKKTATKAKVPFDPSKSNKAIVYTKWAKGKGETDVAKLVKATGGEVKEGTVRGWLSAWNAGKNLPAIANKKKK